MPKFISIRRIHQSILELPEFGSRANRQMVVHLWGFLSLKYKNIAENDFGVFEESDDEKFTNAFLRLNDTDQPYYDPLRNEFVHKTYHHSSLSTMRKGTLVGWDVVEMRLTDKPPKRESWKIKSTYKDEIVSRVLTKGKLIYRFPLLNIIAWLFREEEFADETTVKDVVDIFIERFHLAQVELSMLFDWELTDDYKQETSFFSRHKAPRTLVEQAAGQKMAFDLTISLARMPLPEEAVEVDQIVKLLQLGRGQVILQGPPGTGKTYLAREVAAKILGFIPSDSQSLDDFLQTKQYSRMLEDKDGFEGALKSSGCWEIIQFHPSYTYEDFVRGISAIVDEQSKSTQFRVLNQTFGELAHYSNETEQPIVLIVDEINRGDLSKVLGELVYALEYRGQGVRTPYEVDGSALLTVGKNLLIIATMNTADRSIALIDYAIRRRFDFVDIQSSSEVLKTLLEQGDLKVSAPRILALYEEVATLSGLNKDYAVGHTYFLGDTIEQVASRVVFQVLPLLVEYQKEGLISAESHLTLAGWLGKTGLPLTHSRPFELAAELVDWLSVQDEQPAAGDSGEAEQHDDPSQASV